MPYHHYRQATSIRLLGQLYSAGQCTFRFSLPAAGPIEYVVVWLKAGEAIIKSVTIAFSEHTRGCRPIDPKTIRRHEFNRY
jgi:hypothetical protein